MIFATPDFGASAGIAGCVCGAFVIMLICVGVVFAKGVKLAGQEAFNKKRLGWVLIVTSICLPLCCWLGPSHVFRVVYGSYPLESYPNEVIQKGMSREEVESILGRPHEKHGSDERESWYYSLDSYGIGYFGVIFGPDGRVVTTHGN